MDLMASVEDCDVIIVDDVIDTAGTLCKAASVPKEYGGMHEMFFSAGSATLHKYSSF